MKRRKIIVTQLSKLVSHLVLARLVDDHLLQPLHVRASLPVLSCQGAEEELETILRLKGGS